MEFGKLKNDPNLERLELEVVYIDLKQLLLDFLDTIGDYLFMFDRRRSSECHDRITFAASRMLIARSDPPPNAKARDRRKGLLRVFITRRSGIKKTDADVHPIQIETVSNYCFDYL